MDPQADLPDLDALSDKDLGPVTGGGMTINRIYDDDGRPNPPTPRGPLT